MTLHLPAANPRGDSVAEEYRSVQREVDRLVPALEVRTRDNLSTAVSPPARAV